MKEWIFSLIVVGFVIWLTYWTIEWITLPKYIEEIGNELKEIKEALKDKNL